MKKYLPIALFAILLCTPNVHSQSQTIFDAARSNDVRSIQAYIDQKADLNQKDDRGYTALILATYNQSPEAAELLLSHGASPEAGDGTGRTALMGASFQGDDQCVQLLLKYGARIDATDANGATALMYAVEFGRKSVIRTLIAAHANSTLKDKRGFDALYLAPTSPWRWPTAP